MLKNINNQADFSVKDFRTLKVYQKSIELADALFQLAKNFPPEEKYGITSQILRSSSSIGANIAEGAGQGYKSRTINFCNIAMGSANETRHWIMIAKMRGYINEKQFKKLDNCLDEILKMLIGYMRMVQAQINQENNCA